MKVSRTPFRFSLIGGGSDLPEYYENYGPAKIISMTLSASMYVTYSERNLYSDPGAFSAPIRLSYTKTEHTADINLISHDIIRAVLCSLRDRQNLRLAPSFEITTIADIPSRGAGLGSSSALIVGILNILYKSCSLVDRAYIIAWYAYEIERAELGSPVGFQDHVSAVFGRFRKYECEHSWELNKFTAEDSIGVDFAKHLCAFRLPYNRSDETQSIGKHSTLDDMRISMTERSKYLRWTVELVDPMWEAVAKLDYKEIACILRSAWEYKKQSHAVLDENIDRWYNKGIEAGALAGKVSGSMSGGAGHIFFLAHPDDHDRIREALPELVEFKVEYYPYGSTVQEV